MFGAMERERKGVSEGAAVSRYSITYAVRGLPPSSPPAAQVRVRAVEEAAEAAKRRGADGGTERGNKQQSLWMEGTGQARLTQHSQHSAGMRYPNAIGGNTSVGAGVTPCDRRDVVHGLLCPGDHHAVEQPCDVGGGVADGQTGEAGLPSHRDGDVGQWLRDLWHV